MALQIQNLNTYQRCRICLLEMVDFLSIFDKMIMEESTVSIFEILVMAANIEVSEEDNKPQNICLSCADNARTAYKFKTLCQQSDNILNAELLTILPDDNLPDYESHFLTEDEFSETIECETKPALNDSEANRTCKQCGKTFQYRTSMLKHRKKHGAPPKSCSYCDYVPDSPGDLSKHMEKQHTEKKTITCSICEKRFFKKANLRVHMVMHSGVKRHTCEICGISFALSGNLIAHRRLHTGEKPYTCSDCGKGFTQQAALRSHEAGHSNKKDHMCSQCGVCFSRAGALRNHQKRHLNDRPFKCSMCDKAFAFSSERKRHMTIHTGVKNYECDVCGKRFNRNTNLKVHLRIHTGEKPHVCEACGKGFIQAHCLRSHMATHDNIK